MYALTITQVLVLASLVGIAWATHGCITTSPPQAVQSPQLLAVALDAVSKEGVDVGAYTTSAEWLGNVYVVSFLQKGNRDVRRGFPVHLVVRVSGRGKATVLKGMSEATAVSIAKRKAKSIGCRSFAIKEASYEPEGGSWLVLFEGGPTFPVDPADPDSLTRAGRPHHRSFGVWVYADGSTYISWGR